MNSNLSAHKPALHSIANRANFDLDDDEADLARWPKLQSLLTVVRDSLLPVYLASDAAALRQQRRHSRLVLWAAIFGTLAVLCSIGELAVGVFGEGEARHPVNTTHSSDTIQSEEPDRSNETAHLNSEATASDTEHSDAAHSEAPANWAMSVLSVIELIAASIAIVVVGLGLYSALHPDWLLQRFLAEQCRFVKFHVLLNPAVWYGRTRDEIRASVEAMSHSLRNPDQHLIHEWVTWRVQIAKRFDALPASFPDEVGKELIDYYKVKRLRDQQRYFERQAMKRHRWERWTRNVSPVCFFLSIVAAFTHFLFERIAGDNHEGVLHFLAGVFVLLAAALPVFAMGVRTFRAAHEFGRNKLRFEGMSHFLSDIIALVDKQEPALGVIPLLRESEIALDSEHRAWLRLMIEAEWFG